MENYVSKKEFEKATLLIKRFYATGKMQISPSKNQIELEKDIFTFVQFIDFIQLCVSRKRPHNSGSLYKFVTFLEHHEIPLNLITNVYIKTMIKDGSDSDTEVSYDRKKGSRAMVPRLRETHDAMRSSEILWFKSLDEVS